jgi:hypothetical protein
MFEFNPFEIGNFAVLGQNEEALEERVMACAGFLSRKFGEKVPLEDFEGALTAYAIDFPSLPRWLQAELDRFDVVLD